MKKLWLLGIVAIIVIIVHINSNTGYVVYDRDEIIIPVSVHLVDDRTVQYTTDRDVDDIYRVFEGVNRIWSQGQIRFIVSKMDTIEISNEEFGRVFDGELDVLTQRSDFKDEINGYFARYISANGMAFPPQGFFIIGDITSVNDYRATAHELGHLLGLHHVTDRDYLMSSGFNGELLSQGEVDVARRNARRVYEVEI
jgi:hypothetical protein